MNYDTFDMLYAHNQKLFILAILKDETYTSCKNKKHLILSIFFKNSLYECNSGVHSAS